jgi:hypothetical protein
VVPPVHLLLEQEPCGVYPNRDGGEIGAQVHNFDSSDVTLHLVWTNLQLP